METPFSLVGEDFAKELSTIDHLLTRVGTTDDRLDTDVRLAASNASMLLIAASFEEFVRQEIRESVLVVLDQATDISAVPKELLATVWDRSSYVLKGVKFTTTNFDLISATKALSAMNEFCLDGDLSVDVSDMVAFNMNNMKAKEINEIFKRVGIRDICKQVGETEVIVNFFGSPNPETAHSECVAYLDNFYRERNDVAHSIASSRVVGTTDLERHLEFFRTVGTALVGRLEAHFPGTG